MEIYMTNNQNITVANLALVTDTHSNIDRKKPYTVQNPSLLKFQNWAKKMKYAKGKWTVNTEYTNEKKKVFLAVNPDKYNNDKGLFAFIVNNTIEIGNYYGGSNGIQYAVKETLWSMSSLDSHVDALQFLKSKLDIKEDDSVDCELYEEEIGPIAYAFLEAYHQQKQAA